MTDVMPSGLKGQTKHWRAWEIYKADNLKNPAVIVNISSDIHCLGVTSVKGYEISSKENDKQILFSKDPWNRLKFTPNAFDTKYFFSITFQQQTQQNMYTIQQHTQVSLSDKHGEVAWFRNQANQLRYLKPD